LKAGFQARLSIRAESAGRNKMAAAFLRGQREVLIYLRKISSLNPSMHLHESFCNLG